MYKKYLFYSLRQYFVMHSTPGAYKSIFVWGGGTIDTFFNSVCNKSRSRDYATQSLITVSLTLSLAKPKALNL